MDELLFLDEAAGRLRRPEATLRYWRHKGIGPRSGVVGGRVVYRASDLEDWVSQQLADQSASPQPAA